MSKTFRHWIEWYPWQVVIILSGLFILFSLLVNSISSKLPIPALIVLAIVATAAFLLYALITIVAVCRIRVSAPVEVLLTLLFIVIALLTHPYLMAIIGKTAGIYAQMLPFLKSLVRIPYLLLFGDTFIILAAAFFGRIIGRLIREASMMPVVAVVAAIVDFWGVYWGPVASMTTDVKGNGMAVAQQLSASVPGAQAAAKGGLPVITSIGIGDFLFLAMFFFAIRRLHLNQRGSFWVTFAIILIAPLFYLLGPILPIASNLPGLVFIAIGMVVANWRYMKLSKDEKKALVAAAGIIAVIILVIIFWKPALSPHFLTIVRMIRQYLLK